MDPNRHIEQAQAGTPLALAIRRSPRTAVRVGALLDGGDRLNIIDTLITVLGGAYSHLPQKRAAYAVDPIQTLQLLRARCVELSDGEFHRAVSAVVTGLRDAHTRYIGPEPLHGAVAVLPFLVEQYGPSDHPTFVVSKVSSSFTGDDAFVAGVKLERWNAVPFARAVEVHADGETGGRPDARLARALESMTFRALDYGPPPDEEWVDVGYRPSRGARREVRIPWRVVKPGIANTAGHSASPGARAFGADLAAERVRRAKKLLFAPTLWQAEKAARPAARHGWLPTTFQDTLAARPLATDNGPIGYLRIWSFDVDDDDAFVAEVARLVDALPESGLIIDLRGNPGGLIWAAERLLQLFTPNTIVPTRFSLLASPLTRAMAASAFNRMEFEAWQPSLDRAIATGDAYSQPLPLTDPAWCNDIGQRYSGPVVAVVDPNTYSSGDLFAAGFVDNAIGPLVCVGDATGAGGANVWTHNDIRDALAQTPFAPSVLPLGVGYTIAIRRAVRSGQSDGTPIEDLGVSGIHYSMTRRDLLHDNADLVAFCAALLTDDERTTLRTTVTDDAIVATTVGIDHLDIFVDGRPSASTTATTDGARRLARPVSGRVEILGWRGDTICQRRIFTL